MFERRDPGADVRHAVRADLGIAETRRLTHVEHDRAPGIDDQRMAIGRATIGVDAGLRRGDDVGGRFDRPGAEQDMPMRGPVGLVNAAGTERTVAPASLIARYRSGKRRS